jgi:hypothetical protein
MLPTDDEETFTPKFSRRSPLKPSIKLCPRCLHVLQTGNKLGGWLIPQDYYCPNCGYHGHVFVEKEMGTPEGSGQR